MGKKNKIEAKISDQELVPSTLGYLDESKKGFLGLILLFVIFIAAAVFMPQISNYVNKLLGNNDIDTTTPQITNNDDIEKQENVEDKIEMYELSDNLEFTYNNIKFYNFKINDINGVSYLSFNLNNTLSNIIDFSVDKYYLETYSSNGTLLERHIFNSTKINQGSTSSQNIALTDNEITSINKIVISAKSADDYPDLVLKANSNNEYLLTCNNNTNNIIYTYDKNNKLIKINEVIRYDNDNSTNYSTNLLLYQNRVAIYNNKNGVSSSLVEVLTGFTVTTEIDVKTYKISEFDNDNYYDSSALPKVVKFEMESRGFSCR